MEKIQTEKGTRFFKYLLELNNLVGKVERDYKVFEKSWERSFFDGLSGCRVLSQCEHEENVLEIKKPVITSADEQPPVPPKELSPWLKDSFHNENIKPSPLEKRTETKNKEEEIIYYFKDNEKLKEAFQQYLEEWTVWADHLKEKKITAELYNDFFHLVTRFEQEGDTLEFIFGRGLFTWQHPDPKIGSIRHPLLTSTLELELFAEKSMVTAKFIQNEWNIERDMFSGVNLPNKASQDAVIAEMQEKEWHDSFEDVFQTYSRLIHPEGAFKGSRARVTLEDTPVIYDVDIFALRSKKVRVLRNDLEQIIEALEDDSLELTEAVTSIFEGEIKDNRDNGNDAGNSQVNPLPNNHLYFPLASNEQQKEIVNRIDRNYGVTVQGPPGTGKTHTIANLVSHFLAQGKRILITSQKENALKVLKDKIPGGIRDLCVPVLGGGRESLSEIESSIRVLSEKLGELDAVTLQTSIDRNLILLDQSKREEARLLNELRTYARKEGTSLLYEGDKLYKYDVAKKLAQSDTEYEWIKDEAALDMKFPLSHSQWIEFIDASSKLSEEDLSLKNKKLPQTGEELESLANVEAFIQEGQQLAEYQENGEAVIHKYQLTKEEEFIQSLDEKLALLLRFEAHMDFPVMQRIAEEIKAGSVREQRWRNLELEQKQNIKKLHELYADLITHTIELPEKNVREIDEDIQIVKEHLAADKKPNFMFFLMKGKNTKYLFEDPVLNGKPIEKAEDLVPLEQHLAYHQLKDETARILNGNMAEVNGKTIEAATARFPHEAEEIVNEVHQTIAYVEAVRELEKTWTVTNHNWYDFSYVREVKQELLHAEKYMKFLRWEESFDEKLSVLEMHTKETNMHPIIFEFLRSMKKKDSSAWNILLGQLADLTETKHFVLRFYQLLDELKKELPATAAYIESSFENLKLPEENPEEAFELRKLETWLDETKDMNVARLKDKLADEHKEQKRLVYELVKASTWKSQLERITQQEKRALSSWKSYIKRYGAGTGKSAQTYLKGARESMKTAQGAIPVWIMPVNQVLENFPVTNDKFDVIIFDESSQCDLFSANVLLRGEKIIVVGDEEQISPQAIGTKLDDVYELVRRYLGDVPNANLYDGNISLYEIAEQTFPKEGKLMLREHFRCVPEIIQFSNDLSYGGEMVPLRLPTEEERVDPPVTAVKVNDGYNDEREKDINVPEAERIVEDMAAMAKDPVYKDFSFGVITLQGQKQAAYLETLIREKLGDEEFVRRKVISGDAYTLQGDERDIIFLSMVIAPERNFRALTRNSEKQRMNVAASRAKNQMRLYHSVDLEDLKPDDLRYRLLSYCKNPSRVNQEIKDLETLCDSPFEVDVLRLILARGYKVTPQVKVGRYRIDLVVEGMRNRLAVECDGEAWHGPEKFEDDMQRQESLERAGWEFWRIRGREFYLHRKEALNTLWEKLNEMEIEPAKAASAGAAENQQ